MDKTQRLSSIRRIKCPDFDSSHSSAVYESKTTIFKKIGDLANFLSTQKKYETISITSDDYICHNCYKKFIKRYHETIKQPVSTTSIQATTSTNVQTQQIVQSQPPVSQISQTVESQTFSESSSQSMKSENLSQVSICSLTVIEEINDILKKNNFELSPLKQPSSLNVQSKEQYANRKRKQLVNTFFSETDPKIRKLYDISEKKVEFYDCKRCDEWNRNFNSVISNVTIPYSEKIKILTLLPSSMSKNDIEKNIPSVTSHMIKMSRKNFKSKGLFSTPDPYCGHALSEDTVNLVQKYYLEDDLDCSIQSPNKNDVVSVKINGVIEKKVKRFLTRSIKSMYCIFKEQNPNVSISRTKFYELRPKWVRIEPLENSCLCICCANFDLLIIALKNVMNKKYSQIPEIKIHVLSLITCSDKNDACLLQECENCPGGEGINMNNLKLDENDVLDEVYFAVWEKNELIKKVTSFTIFLEELKNISVKYNKHNFIKNLQKQEILIEKGVGQLEEKYLILHMDFAENWAVQIKNAIQSYYWKNNSVSLLTAVSHYGNETKSFVVVSDDKHHDTAHALLAEEKILEKIKMFYSIDTIDKITKITDGAAAHFKNRFQLYELGKKAKSMKYIFSAPGHGKGAPDGLGSLVKHFATKHNLNCSYQNCIQNAKEFYEIVQKYVENVQLIFLDTEEVQQYRNRKEQEWKTVSKVNGIRDCFTWKADQIEVIGNLKIVHSMRKTAKHDWVFVNF